MPTHSLPGFLARRPRGARIAIIGALAIAAGAGLALGFSALVEYLWNAVMPQISGAGRLDLWRALGLLVLARLLIGGFHRGHGGHHRFGRKESSWRLYEEWWRETGEQSFKEWADNRPEAPRE